MEYTPAQVTLQGEPGLGSGRLRLVEFDPALQALLKATRNIAADYVAKAVGTSASP